MTYSGPNSFEAAARFHVTASFKELLSSRHLYQGIIISTDFISELAGQLARADAPSPQTSSIERGGLPFFDHGMKSRIEKHMKQGRSILSLPWIPEGSMSALEILNNGIASKGKGPSHFEFPSPTINTFCSGCRGRWPFAPVKYLHKAQSGRCEPIKQWFFLTYECQNCNGEPVRFLVRRTDDKLTLAGRDPIESVETPKLIPKVIKNRFGSAVVAYQSGQPLAASFLLRVLIEQYWKSIPAVVTAVASKNKPTGDELGSAYKAILDEDFRRKFPTLCETYERLSIAIHSAD